MSYIKRLTMHGFKSFVRKTELPFTPGINVILGPNGAGKSNLSDALCFVLGRLSIKSMRAAKAKNLIFLGTKSIAPAKEASVELVFDNSDKIFSIQDKEVIIKRIVRKNGQSIYKINNQIKTRQEVLALLAQAGIDPNGFNIILQGEIQNFVKMHTEERRKIIEEVSGISIYESRKEKSLRELEKTEEKLKEIMSILRERTIYLNNLEKERQEALRFKKLEKDVQRYKASIIYHDLTKNKKQIENLNLEIDSKNKAIEKVKKEILNLKTAIGNYEENISSINSSIQKSTGLEQEKLNKEIANIRADLAGMNVRLENYESKLINLFSQKQEFQEMLRDIELSIKELQKTSGSKEIGGGVKKELQKKKQELEQIEEERKKFYMFKSELKSIKERFQDKRDSLQNYENESEFLIKQIKLISKDLFDKDSTKEKLGSLKFILEEKKEELESLEESELELEKISYANEKEIEKQDKLIEKISKMDICPICKSKITQEHVDSINSEVRPIIDSLKKEINDADRELREICDKKELLKQEIEQIEAEISKRGHDLINLTNINEKNLQIKSLYLKTNSLKAELAELDKRRKYLENNLEGNTNIEQKYETMKIEVQEISLRSQENIESEVSFKQRELERLKISLKQLLREETELKEELNKLAEQKKKSESLLDNKKQQEEKLVQQFQKLIAQKESLQKNIRNNETEISTKQNIIYSVEQDTNNLKIERARFNAIIENLEMEMLSFPDVEIIKESKEALVQKLSSTQEKLLRIGSVNLRSLEVYDSIKQEYEIVKEKVETISREKEGVLKIIHEIDIKKRKAFLKTLQELNEIFSRNFMQLSVKGKVSLELENKKDPFEGGVGILVKTGHGKYFDVTSLSGGEQTLVALSLIFAIQELNPYCFYILDEIDAALDKRNSERLANLLRKYMQKGQYIIITHNDEIFTSATNLYGVSMHEGVSKIVSLKV